MIEMHEWSCTCSASCMMLRIELAFSGIVMPSASSTARTEVSACVPVQTPQMRSVKAQASRGSRPLQDHLDAAPHRAGRDRVADDVVGVDIDLDAQVAFDAGDRIDDDALAGVVEIEAVRRLDRPWLRSLNLRIAQAVCDRRRRACVASALDRGRPPHAPTTRRADDAGRAPCRSCRRSPRCRTA